MGKGRQLQVEAVFCARSKARVCKLIVSHRRLRRAGLYRAFMFSSPTIMVATPEACKQVLMDDDTFVTGWPKATVALIGPKSFVNMGYDEHRRLRKLTAAPINGFDVLTSYLGFIDHTVVTTLRGWSERSDHHFEFLRELRRMTFWIIDGWRQRARGGRAGAHLHGAQLCRPKNEV